MTRRELNLAIFQGTAQQVLWQPRLETWIPYHRNHGTLPAHLRGLDDLQIYDALGCSCRYAAHAGIKGLPDPEVSHSERHEGKYLFQTTTTPAGSLTWVYQEVWEDGKVVNSRIHEFPVKTVEDLRVLTDLIEREHYAPDFAAAAAADARVGIREEPNIFTSSSGFTDLIKFYSGLLDANYLLYDYPAAVETYLDACDRRDDRLFDAALQLPHKIYNLGDHPTNDFTPPPILKRYLLPRWQRLSARIGAAGRFVHSHWDGPSRLILPFLQDSGLHGVEALTPEPMADMTLEQIKTAVGDKMVCLDLIPAIFFLEQYSLPFVLDFTKRVIDMFAPRLILGVSDELPPFGQIEKIEAISQLLRDTCGLAE
jgi:hypothetical protein